VLVSQIVLFVSDLTGPGCMWAHVLYVQPYVTYHVTLVVHVCATTHLTKWVFGVCLDGPAKRSRPRRENLHLTTLFHWDTLLPANTNSITPETIEANIPRGTDIVIACLPYRTTHPQPKLHNKLPTPARKHLSI